MSVDKSDKIWELECSLLREREDLIKRAIASLPREDAITFLYGLVEDASAAMWALEKSAWEARQDAIDALLPATEPRGGDDDANA